MQKGMSVLVSMVLVVLISVVAIGAVLAIGLPAIDKFRESAVVGEAQGNMKILDDAILQTASEGAGIVRQVQLSVSDGSYIVNPTANSLDFSLLLKSNLIPKGTLTKVGNLQTSASGVVSASQNGTNIILENDILQVVMQKVGSSTAFDTINTSGIIKTVTMKSDGTVFIPNDTSIIISNITNTSWGTGYTQIAREGANLPRADVLEHVMSNMTGVEYDVVYTLPGSSDFLLVNVRNVTGNRTTLNYAYKIGSSNSDKIKIGDIGNITSFSVISTTTTSSASNQTTDLQNTNYTKNPSSLTLNLGSATVVQYNASDGTLRNVSELADIGQGNWSFASTSSTTALNYTLAGQDGYDFGVRDSLPGGSYWINPDGSLYGRVNISNDFITVGLASHNLTVYNSSQKIIFNTSFDNAAKIDGQDFITTYGTGTQNKTVYFFDWANQSWKVWTKGVQNATHGYPDWLDPRNKQEFKWRYAFKAQNQPQVNFTLLMTAADPFVRTFIDSGSAITATGGTVTYANGREIHTFTANGTFNVTSGSGNVQVLAVAGGGGGGGELGGQPAGGGGGAGGYQYNSAFPVSSQAYSVTVGAGGSAGAAANAGRGGNGSNSTFGTIVAIGGGGGGSYDFPSHGQPEYGAPGGSGGGGTWITPAASGGGTGSQGGNGGGGDSAGANQAGGGGGGAGANGASIVAGGTTGGVGGDGTANGISGASVTYAGGGGGGGNPANNGGGSGAAGGSGGGGAGGSSGVGTGVGTSGTANTGGGGGGAGGTAAAAAGGAGGSGIVIVSFPISDNITIPISLPENKTSVTTAEPGLVGYWNFNEGQGLNASDSSGNGNVGKLVDNVNWVSNYSCAIGNCLGFGSTTGNVSVANPTGSLSITNGLTISGWVKLSSTSPLQYHTVAIKGTTEANENYYFGIRGVDGGANDRLIMAGSTYTAAREVFIPEGWAANRWYFITGTITSGGVVSVYLNGTLRGISSGDTLVTNSLPLQIGSVNDPAGWTTNFFNGYIDDLRIYNRVLNESEVKQLYLTGINQNKPGIYFTSNNATANEEVLFATTNIRNIYHSTNATPSNFQIFSNQTNFFGFNYTFNSTINQNFMFSLGTMGRMNTTNFNPQTNASQFSGETLESIANSTMTYYDLFDGSLAGWWKLNEGSGTTTADSSGNNNTANITTTQPTWVTNSSCKGGFGNCLSFNGNQNSNNVTVDSPSPSLLSPNSYTYMMWLNPNGPTSTAAFGIGDTVQDQAIDFPGTAVRGISYDVQTGTATTITGGTSLSNGVWYQVALVRDAGSNTLNLYVNGKSDATPVALKGPTAAYDGTKAKLYIGGWYRGSFKGMMDNVKVYSRVLSPDEIGADYLAAKDDYPNLKTVNQTNGATSAATPAYFYDGGAAGIWHFDEGGGLNATDASGNGNVGTLPGNSSVTWVTNSSCKFGSCLSFDGVNGYVNAGTSPSLKPTGAVTVEAWAMMTSSAAVAKVIAATRSGGGYSGYALILDVGDAHPFWVVDTSASPGGAPWDISLTGTTTVKSNVWYHVVGTYKNGIGKLYVNGIQEASGTTSGTIDYSLSDFLKIGEGGGNIQFFPGLIDELRIYNRELSASEVREHYQQGASKYYDDFGTAANAKTYRYYGVEDSNTTLQPIDPSGTILHYRFNDNSSVNVTDVSGSGNTGIILTGNPSYNLVPQTSSNMWTTNSSCQNDFGGCMVDNGTFSVYPLNNNAFNFERNNPFSLGLWVKDITGLGGGGASHWWISKFYGGDKPGYYLAISVGAISWTLGNGSTYAAGISTSFTPRDDGLWHHLMATTDGTGTAAGMKIYYDGVAQGTSVGADNLGTKSILNDQPFLIGNRGDGNGAFVGYMDDVMVVNRTLTPDEVYNIYLGGAQRHAGDLVGWWKFNQNATAINSSYPSSSVLDSSGGGNTGTLVNGPTWMNNASCKINGCLSFDGTNDYVDVTSSRKFDLSDFTISAWAKYNSTGGDQRIVSRDNNGASPRDAFALKSTSVPSNGGLVPGGPGCNLMIDNSFVSVFSAASKSDNNWHSLACVREGTNIKVYVDGLFVNQTTGPAGKFDADIDLTIGNILGADGGSGEYFNGTIDNVKVWKRALTPQEVMHEYIQTQDQNSIYGAIHRITSADDIQSISYNLTDKNSTFERNDYDQRTLYLNGTLVNTISVSGAPNPNCFTLSNISQPYACSYDDSEFSTSKVSGLVYAGGLASFSSVCEDTFLNQTGSPYKFNLTATGQTKALIPFANGVCTDIGNKTRSILAQGSPSTPFGSYLLTGPTSLLLSLQYDRIKLGGDMRFGAGINQICLKKVGQSGLNVLINVTSC